MTQDELKLVARCERLIKQAKEIQATEGLGPRTLVDAELWASYVLMVNVQAERVYRSIEENDER